MENSKYEYVKLIDKEHFNNIVRCKGRQWERYVDREWKQTGILLKYFCDESPLYGCYEKINEKEAMTIIKAS